MACKDVMHTIGFQWRLRCMFNLKVRLGFDEMFLFWHRRKFFRKVFSRTAKNYVCRICYLTSSLKVCNVASNSGSDVAKSLVWWCACRLRKEQSGSSILISLISIGTDSADVCRGSEKASEFGAHIQATLSNVSSLARGSSPSSWKFTLDVSC